MYTCASYYHRRDSDSIAVDSLANDIIEQEMVLDEYGNMVVKPKENSEDASQQQDKVPAEAEEPKQNE
jgi:hypothetical protein